MKNSFENIENLFSDSFRSFRVDPNPHVWNSIEKNIFLEQGYQSLTETLKNYKTQPGSGVWKGISNKLWFRNFISFNALQFNVYYAGIIVLTTAGIFYLNQNNVDNTQTNTNVPSVTSEQNPVSAIQENAKEITGSSNLEKNKNDNAASSFQLQMNLENTKTPATGDAENMNHGNDLQPEGKNSHPGAIDQNPHTNNSKNIDLGKLKIGVRKKTPAVQPSQNNKNNVTDSL